MPRNSLFLLLIPAAFAIGCGGDAAATSTGTVTAKALSDSLAKDSTAKAAKFLASHPGHNFDTAAAGGVHPMLREKYEYENGGVRDPFRTLTVAVERGPELPDLRLVSILFDDRDPASSIVTFRDIGSDQRYTLKPGERLGRLSIVTVKDNSVKLREDDLGTSHEQTYVLHKTEDGQ